MGDKCHNHESMFVSMYFARSLPLFEGKPQVIECVTNSGSSGEKAFYGVPFRLKTIIITLRELWHPNVHFLFRGKSSTEDRAKNNWFLKNRNLSLFEIHHIFQLAENLS